MTITRRSLCASAGVALLGGCVTAPTSSAHLEPPDELTNESVAEYVETREAARYRERVLANRSTDLDDPDDLRVGCHSRVMRGREDEYYAWTSCGGALYFNGGVADLIQPYVVVYRVTPESVDRVVGDSDRHKRSIEELPGQTRLWILATNFSASEQTLALAITADDDGQESTIYEEERTLGPETVVWITSIAAVSRDVTFSAALDGGESAVVGFEHDWGGRHAHTFAVHVPPDEALVVGGW